MPRMGPLYAARAVMSGPEDRRPGPGAEADEAFGRVLRERLRQSERLDPRTQTQLRAARRRALAQAGRPSLRPSVAWTAGALAAGMLVALLAPWRAPVPEEADWSADSLALLLDEGTAAALDAGEHESLGDEQLQLYLWLGQEEPDG